MDGDGGDGGVGRGAGGGKDEVWGFLFDGEVQGFEEGLEEGGGVVEDDAREGVDEWVGG